MTSTMNRNAPNQLPPFWYPGASVLTAKRKAPIQSSTPQAPGLRGAGLRPAFLFLDLVDRPANLFGFIGRACDQTLLHRLSKPEPVVHGPQQQDLAEQVQPGGQQEKEPELRAVGVEPAREPFVDRKAQGQSLDEDARQDRSRQHVPQAECA